MPAAVGTKGWETPLGEHRVLFKAVDPVWRHSGTGVLIPPGGRNPWDRAGLPSYQDCSNPGGWDGEKLVQARGCSHVGLHGTPHRWTVGWALSHGCVRHKGEHIRRVFDLVDVGNCLLGLFAALLVPMSGVVTQGVKQDHPALDISCRVGRPVRAAHDGVGRSRWTATHGWTFHLAGAGVKTRYSHLNAGAPAGSYDCGQIIVLCGNKGRWSIGLHLHFEAEPLHLLDVLKNSSAEQLKLMEQAPQWRQRSVEASH